VQAHLGLVYGQSWGVGAGNQQRCLPMPGRGGLGSGEVRARSGLKAVGEASVGAHGHVGVLKQWRP
jgi:hypothetical protein